ncbi:MAG: hydroxymethylbilane synthase [Bacillota bacterium]
MKLKIASRKSKLAQMQTEIIMELIYERHGVQTEKYLMDTQGDMILDISLEKIGGKGLFTKDIEIALLEKRADAAVHSMKDVPYALNDAFEISAILQRVDVRDVLISREGRTLRNLRKGSIIGTSSNRRAAQLKEIRPDIMVVPVRGNIQTRISKIEKENLDGIILAAAGVKRMKLESIITEYLDPEEFVPAVGQGALGVEVFKESEDIQLFRSLDDFETRICVEAERSFMKELQGGCHSAMGAYAVVEGTKMKIIGIFDVAGKLTKKTISGVKEEYLQLGVELAQKILKG